MNTTSGHGPVYIEKLSKWKQYHSDNPHIWKEFESLSDELRKVTSKSSAWLVINRIRWDHAIRTKGEEFKISNDYIGIYARVYMASKKERNAFFTIRGMEDECFEHTRKLCGMDA